MESERVIYSLKMPVTPGFSDQPPRFRTTFRVSRQVTEGTHLVECV